MKNKVNELIQVLMDLAEQEDIQISDILEEIHKMTTKAQKKLLEEIRIGYGYERFKGLVPADVCCRHYGCTSKKNLNVQMGRQTKSSFSLSVLCDTHLLLEYEGMIEV